MASPSGSPESCLKALRKEPHLFSFVQAVRLLEQAAGERWSESRIGHDNLPSKESLRIVAQVARSFAPAEVVGLNDEETADEETRQKLTVAFMGLFGPSGVLPYHDTQRLIDTGTRKNPERDFLDMFNHRILSLFYRASTKYRIPFSFESTYGKAQSQADAVTHAFYAVAGMATPGLQNRLECHDEFYIQFSGFHRQQTKNAISLQSMLGSYLELPVEVLQFVGEWVFLSAENRSEMPSTSVPVGSNCALGSSFILGERVWDISGKFRVRIGPLTLAEFDKLLPGSQLLTQLAQITRMYVGKQYNFDIQLILRHDQVPPIKLSERGQLGWNTWLTSHTPAADAADAVFEHSGLPLGR